MESLEGRVALVTGGSRGIGRECAIALGGVGCTVAVNYRNREREAEEACEIIRQKGGKARAFQADISRLAEVRTLAAEVRSTLGPVGILVNNAGISAKRSLPEVTEAEWDEMMDANLKSCFFLTQAVLRDMQGAKWGRIINISSNAVFTGGGISSPHYLASKAGMLGLTHAFALSYVKEGITSNAVAPGSIETDMLLKDLGVTAARSPIGRFGRAEEIAEAVLMLARNAYMTGQTLVISGGSYMT